MRGYLKLSSRRWVRTTLRAIGRMRVVHQFTLDHRRQPGSRNNLRVPRTGRRHHRLGRLERSGRAYGDVTPLPLGEAGAPASRLAPRGRGSGLATFPKELTMNIEDEILNIRTKFARIEGRLSGVYRLPELYPA